MVSYRPPNMITHEPSPADPRSWARPLISVVVPCFNEEEVIHETNRRLLEILEIQDFEFEIIYVNDGSRDTTVAILCELQAKDDRLRVIDLSRNFGHQVAATAGIDHAAGHAVVLIDADLQDPPELIPQMVSKWREGNDVVYGIRIHREGESNFKLWTASAFYRLLDRVSHISIPPDAGDFRLLDRAVVQALQVMPERDRFLRGMVAWAGFRQVGLPYRRAARFAGASKYPLLKMLRFAADGIASFSTVPLRLATWLGFSASVIALFGSLFALFFRLFTHSWVPGWSSIFLAVLFLGGAQLICLGIIGEYLGRVYGEVKHRPLYLVRRRFGCDEPLPADTSLLAVPARQGPR